MAAHNAPKHDFAPAWLKIPSQENPKPAGSKILESDKSARSRPNYYSRHPNYAELHRQNSFENYYDGKRRGPPRHHSVDDDYYPYPPYGHYGYYNGYGMHYNSNPSIFRSPPSREPKYPQHPSMRFGQMNGGYPGYYDLYAGPFDYYGEQPFFSSYPSSRNSKKSHYEKEGRSNSKEGKEKDINEKPKTKEDEEGEKPILPEDFPSLNGDENNEKASKITNGGSVWEHPPHGKNNTSKFGERGPSSNIYKTLVPNKLQGSVSRKPKENVRFNGGFASSSKPLTPPGVTPNKEGSRLSPTPPMEILNTRLVTQPRHLGDKKSEFLRALRRENSGYSPEDAERAGQKSEGLDLITNGIGELEMNDNSEGLLSSSLEAEQRLLKEMGWTESDEEEYEITEDEKKEFQDRCSKQSAMQKNNGRFQKTLSPKHVPIYQPNVSELNDTISSSDSDTDDNA